MSAAGEMSPLCGAVWESVGMGAGREVQKIKAQSSK
jgi:hypothetical protein